MDDDAIRSLIKRLGRPHKSGGLVVEHAAITSQGPSTDEILAWVQSHGGVPEEDVMKAPARGLHSAREHEHAGARPKTPQRYLLPPGALDAPAAD